MVGKRKEHEVSLESIAGEVSHYILPSAPDSIGVLLVKLLGVHVSLDELPSEELDGVLEREPDALEEEAILEPCLVLEVVRGGQGLLHGTHAQGEALLTQRLDHVGGHAVAIRSRVVLASVAAVEVTKDLCRIQERS